MPRRDYAKHLLKVMKALEAAGKSCKKTPDEDLVISCPGRDKLTFGPAMPFWPPERKPHGGVPVSFLPMGIPSKGTGAKGLSFTYVGGIWPKIGDDKRNAWRMDVMRGPPPKPGEPGPYITDQFKKKQLKRTPEHERQRMIAQAIRDDPDLNKELNAWKKKVKCKHRDPPCEGPNEVPDPRNPESDSGLDVEKYVEMESPLGAGRIAIGVCIEYWFRCHLPPPGSQSAGPTDPSEGPRKCIDAGTIHQGIPVSGRSASFEWNTVASPRNGWANDSVCGPSEERNLRCPQDSIPSDRESWWPSGHLPQQGIGFPAPYGEPRNSAQPIQITAPRHERTREEKTLEATWAWITEVEGLPTGVAPFWAAARIVQETMRQLGEPQPLSMVSISE